MYYLPYRASARAEYRYYTDTWGVEGVEHRVRLCSAVVEWNHAGSELSVLHAGRERFLQRPVSAPELAELPQSRQRTVGVLVEHARRRADVCSSARSSCRISNAVRSACSRTTSVHVRRLSRRDEGRYAGRRTVVQDGLDDRQGVRLVLVLKSSFAIRFCIMRALS